MKGKHAMLHSPSLPRPRIVPVPLGPPAEEPVTFEQAQVWLRADNAAEADLVSTLAVAARMIVEAESGRRLIAQTWRLVMDAWPEGDTLHVPLTPLISVDAMRIYDADSQPQTVPSASYIIDTASDPGRIVFTTQPAAPGRSVSGIEVDITAGYGADAAAVPAPLRQAVLLLLAHWYAQRNDSDLRIDKGLPPEVAPLIAPYRLRRL